MISGSPFFNSEPESEKQSWQLRKHTYESIGKWMTTVKNTGAARYIIWLGGVCIAGVVTLLGFYGSTLWDQNARIAAIEANRFTSKDGTALLGQINALAQKIAQMPQEVPPKWFLDRVNKIETRQEQILQELNNLSRLVSTNR